MPANAGPRPSISVVLTTFDRLDLLRRSLSATLSQSMSDFEVIVVDDGSEDGSREFLSSLAEDQVRLVFVDRVGPCAARNAGLEAAHAEWVVFLDDDDIPQRTWLEDLLAPASVMVGLVSAGAYLKEDPQDQPGRLALPEPRGPTYDHLSGVFLAGTFAVRADLARSAGGYDSSLACNHQTDFVWRLLPQLAGAEMAVATVDRPVITIERQPIGERWRSQPDVLLRGMSSMFERHGARIRRDKSVEADYAGVAGVAAARVGRWSDARKWFLRAVSRKPRQPKRYAQLVLACVPPLGRRFWGSGSPDATL